MVAKRKPPEDDSEPFDLSPINDKVDLLQGPNGGFFLPSFPNAPAIGTVTSFTVPMLPGKIPDFVVDLTRPEVGWFRNLVLAMFTLLYLFGVYKVSSI